jgi:serine/threonine-protein kinase
MDDLAQALRFALSFCDGMVHLRSKGVQAHRDIKPQNCLITEDGVLKITDFGLVKVRGEVETEMRESSSALDSLTVSRTGRATGTATHMPPEQFRDSKHVGVTADIYSFGVTLFQMLTGILPYSAWTWDEWAEAHMY